MNIGVFDSGIGGKAIAQRLERDYPEHRIFYVDDSEHVPYGSRQTEEIIQLTDAAIQPLLTAQCDIIVLACNTATAAAIEVLREKYPHTPFIGLEPMVKPAAAMTESGVIGICATPATLSSPRYQSLKRDFAQGVRVLEPDCSAWAEMIEHNQVQYDAIARVVEAMLLQQADVIILACTHYHWIKEYIVEQVGDRAAVIDPSEAISRRVSDVLLEKQRRLKPEVV